MGDYIAGFVEDEARQLKPHHRGNSELGATRQKREESADNLLG